MKLTNQRSIAISMRWTMKCFALFGLLLPATLQVQSQAAANPILSGTKADPEILFFNNKYYIYPTTENGGTDQFHAYSSTDLTNWVDEGVIFNLATQCSWGKYWGWAPSVAYRNGQYYFYYSAALKIGVAVGPSPTGPFTDLGAPLVNTGDDIDPFVFIDDNGQAYLYNSGGGQGLVVRKLNSNMTTFSTGPTTVTPSNFTEGAHVLKRNGVYYLSYSQGAWNNATYQANYSTGASPMGPWTYKGAVLRNNGPFTGNGHHSIVKRPGCDEYYIAYHRFENGDYSGRRVALDRLYFNSAGDMLQVNQTWAGVPARPAGAACITPNPIPNGTYWIQSRTNANSGGPLVMEITGCNQGAGANVATWTANNSCNNQRWTLTYSDNFYKIVSAEPNALSLDLSGCLHGMGTDLKAWTQNGWDCQLFRIEQAGPAGYYRIMSKQSGYVADIAAASNVPGADIGVWEWYGQNNQLWKFSATLPTAPAARMSGTATNEELAIYPNPANTELTINFKKLLPVTGNFNNIQVKLVNLLGVVVRTISVKPGFTNLRIDTKGIPNGSYYLHVNNGAQSTSKLVFIRHGN